MMFKTLTIGVLAMTLLSSCGGSSTGSGGTTSSYLTLSDPAPSGVSPIRTHTVAGASGSETFSASYNRATDTIEVGGIPGTFNPQTRVLTMNDGSIISLEAGQTDYVVAFTAEPANGSPFSGVFGVPTLPADVRTSGTATYVGNNQATVQIIDGDNNYDLTGTATLQLLFGAGANVDLTINNLSGTMTNGLNTPAAVINVAVVHINDAVLAGGVFSGGNATITSTQLSALSGGQLVDTSGGLFGPGGNEVGGVFLIDDLQGAGVLLLQGWYTAG